MIHITVDMDKCQHYGQCVFEAEDVSLLYYVAACS